MDRFVQLTSCQHEYELNLVNRIVKNIIWDIYMQIIQKMHQSHCKFKSAFDHQ